MSATPTQLLTKSRILSARQCRKRLWLESYAPELAQASDNSRGILSAGESIGRLARRVLADDGELIEGPVVAAAEQTAKHLNAHATLTLHEASFGAASVFVRADLLWQKNGELHVAEVKSSSKVKAYHIEDCAVQYWVMREAGYKPDAFYLAHINNEFVLGQAPAEHTAAHQEDAITFAGLFNLAPLNSEIAAALPQVPKWIRAADEVLASDKPAITTGPHCKKPHACPFIAHCQEGEPQIEYPVGQFPGLKAKTKQQLQANGATDIRDVDASAIQFAAELKEPEALARWHAAQTGKAWRSSTLHDLLTNLEYPRYYLDFESIAFTVPIWPGSKPFEQFPFQYSLHCEPEPGAPLQHMEFLDLSGKPPMRQLSEALIAALGHSGPIVVYTNFERTCINALARRFTDLAPQLQAINQRLFDLHAVVKKHYYHPAQNGSYSIKKLLPVVLKAGDADYASLDGVSDGLAAQRAYAEAINLEDNSEQKQQLEHELLEYCKLDTLAMVKVVHRLQHPMVDNH